MTCDICGEEMKPLLTSMYCPNECDRLGDTPIVPIDIEAMAEVESSIDSDKWNRAADDDMDEWLNAVDEWWNSRSTQPTD